MAQVFLGVAQGDAAQMDLSKVTSSASDTGLPIQVVIDQAIKVNIQDVMTALEVITNYILFTGESVTAGPV